MAFKAIITTKVLVMGINFGGHIGRQNVQGSMGQNGMVTSCVQSTEQIGSKRIVTGKLTFKFLTDSQLFRIDYTTRDNSILEHTYLYILPTKMAAEIDATT